MGYMVYRWDMWHVIIIIYITIYMEYMGGWYWDMWEVLVTNFRWDMSNVTGVCGTYSLYVGCV